MQIPIVRIENFTTTGEKDASGPMLCVYLDVENKRLLATNGHMAARVTITTDENDVTGLVPFEAFELARKELKNIIKINGKDNLPDPWLKVVANEDSVFIENLLTNTTHLVNRPKLEKGQKFPNVDAVYPELTEKPTVSLAGSYLAEIVKSLDGEGTSLWVQADDKAVVIASSFGKASVVLMPRREEIDAREVSRRGAPETAPIASEGACASVVTTQ